METFGIMLLVLILGLAAGMLIGLLILWDDEPAWHEQRDRQLRVELGGLRAANRINVASWCAKEEMQAEADRHREGGDGPW